MAKRLMLLYGLISASQSVNCARQNGAISCRILASLEKSLTPAGHSCRIKTSARYCARRLAPAEARRAARSSVQVRFYFSFVMRRALLLLLSVAIVGVLGNSGTQQTKKLFPPGMHPSLFPEPIFDPNAPDCIPGREPCGFYSFSLHGGSQLKWVKSWCQCDDEHECSYDRTDMKMRVYRHVCVSKTELARLADALLD